MIDDTDRTDRSQYADEEWLSVQIVEGEEVADLIQGYLESEGLPVALDSRYSHEFPTHVGHLAEIEVRVPASRAEEARSLLEAREAAFEGRSAEGTGGAEGSDG